MVQLYRQCTAKFQSLHHSDFSENGAPGGVQCTGLLGLLAQHGPTSMPRPCLVPLLPVKVYNLFFCGLPCLSSAPPD